MQNKIRDIQRKFQALIKDVKDLKSLEDIRVKFLGRKGLLTEVLKGLKDLSLEAKKEIGSFAHAVKQEIEEALEEREVQVSGKEKDISIDLTQPGEKEVVGHFSPLTTTRRVIEEVFCSMGFMVLDGPWLESEYYNFDALNIPSWHPAREIWDTFYVENSKPKIQNPKFKSPSDNLFYSSSPFDRLRVNSVEKFDHEKNRLLLRTHTSPMQVRAMQKYGAPIRLIVPGQTFRNEATDARHEMAFWQVEGLVVDKGISLQHLISISRTFVKAILRSGIEVKFRPGYFPFVEPGLEMDISCLLCKSKGCSLCKKTGWLEFMGAGMVHPRVLEYGGVDPDQYSGFAFGFGLERIVMLKYGIDDIRLFKSQDLRFFEQF